MAPLFWPLDKGHIITSPFGNRDGGFHTGTDFGWPGGSAGRAVYAIQSGTVIYSGAADGYGGPDPAGWLVIDSDDAQGSGCYEYGHIVREVAPGARVVAGQRIARINPDTRTNAGVAPHLHVSFMPREYNPATKTDPMIKLRAAAQFPGAPVVAPPVVVPAPPTTGFKPVGEFPCAQTLLTQADAGRRPMPPQLQVIHTNEGGPYARGKNPGSVLGLLQFCANLRNEASYNIIIGRGVNDSGRCNSDDYAPWAAGQIANTRGLHICALGWSAQPRDEWLSYDAQMNTIAAVLAHNSVVYGIPLVRVTAADIRAGKRGVCGHADTSAAWRETDHTDPGTAFPYDDVLARAQRIVSGTSTGDTDMTPEQSRRLDVLYDEFTKRFASRSRYAADPTALIDTAVGFILNGDARSHEISVDMPKGFAQVNARIDALTAAVSKLQKVG